MGWDSRSSANCSDMRAINSKTGLFYWPFNYRRGLVLSFNTLVNATTGRKKVASLLLHACKRLYSQITLICCYTGRLPLHVEHGLFIVSRSLVCNTCLQII